MLFRSIDVNGLVDQTWSLVPSTAVGGSTFSTPVYQANGNGTQIWSVGSSEQMRLTSTGLGIGTSSPAAKLDVVSTGNTQLALSSTSAGSPGVFMKAAGGGNPTINYYTGQNLRFATADDTSYTSYTERMRLDSSGNLGLGVTPSAWISTWKAMEYQGGAVLSPTTNNIQLAANAYYGN